MSVVHRSLEQLRRNKAANGAPLGKGNGGQLPGKRSPTALLAALLFLLIGLAVAGGVWFFQDDLRSLGVPLPMAEGQSQDAEQTDIAALKARARASRQAPAEEQTEAEDAMETAAEPETSETAPEPQARAEAPAQEQPKRSSLDKALEARPSQTFSPQPSDERQPVPEPQLNAADQSSPPQASSGQMGAGQLGAPQSLEQDAQAMTGDQAGFGMNVELERHFAQQARRNHSVMGMERGLVAALRAGDMDSARDRLDALLKRIGKHSTNGLKWQGYFELKKGDCKAAEAAYRRAFSQSPHDVEIAYNLLLCLTCQERWEDAKVLYSRVVELHPADERLLSFGEVLRR